MIQVKQDLFKDWYSRAEVKFEIIRFLQNREFACLVPSWFSEGQKKSKRNLRCHNIQQLDFILNRWLKPLQQGIIYNLYYSMSKFRNGFPIFKGNSEERREKVEEYKKVCFKDVVTYDWLVDVDALSHSENNIYFAYESAKTIKKLFDKFKVPYELRFSGKGFHFIVQAAYLRELNLHYEPFINGSIYRFLTNLSKVLNEKYSELIDWKIPDSRRVAKIPYSISFYKGQDYICIPFLSDKEFNDFELEKMIPDKWMSFLKTNVRNRGSFLFNKKFEPIDKFLKYLEVKK